MLPSRILTILSAACLLSFASAQEAPRPNILFIFCDDLGYGDLGVFHQNERAAKKDRSVPFFTTPHIDGMAGEGMRLTQHYCGAPVCAPSRASLLSGTHQGHAAIRDNQFDRKLPDTLTLASVLKQGDYATAAFGKWGLQGKPNKEEKRGQNFPAGQTFPGWPSLPVDRGFDYFLGYVRHRDGHYHYPVEDKKQVWENKTEISKGMELCFTTDLFTAAAKRWIVEHHQAKPKQPFFVYLAHDTPHAKLQNPPCAYPKDGGLKGGVQWLGEPGRMINTAQGTYDGWVHPDYAEATWDHDKDPATPEQAWPEVQQRYANNVRRIDDTVGDLLFLLDDLGIADNTLVIFSSDNGPSQESYIKNHPYHPTFFHGFGPFDGIKRDTLEGGMRVPTLARWPDQTRPGRIATQASGHWDWLATFAEAAGLPLPAASDGVSLMPTLNGKAQQQPSTIYSEYAVGGRTPKYDAFAPSHRGKPRGQMQVIHLDGYKGLRTAIESADDDFEIYDLTKDPQEIRNLDSAEGMAKIQTKMKARVLQLRRPHPDAKRPYDETLIPAEMPLETKITGGLLYKTYVGSWPWMPRFESLAKQPTMHGNTLDLKQLLETLQRAAKLDRRYAPPLGLQVHGFLKIPADGKYQFEAMGNGHSMLFVHDIRLIDENAEEGRHVLSGSLPLKAGWHPVRYLHRTKAGKAEFGLRLFAPNGTEIPLNQKTAGHLPQ